MVKGVRVMLNRKSRVSDLANDMLMLTQTRMVINKMKWAVMASALLLAGCSTVPPATPTLPPVVEPPPVVAEPVRRPPRLGLALGGGAARGFAHVGVIQVLEQNGIHPDLVVGTSAGILVAAMCPEAVDVADL